MVKNLEAVRVAQTEEISEDGQVAKRARTDAGEDGQSGGASLGGKRMLEPFAKVDK